MKTTTLLSTLATVVALGFSSHAKQFPVTPEQQKAMTPEQVLADLMAGNERFVAGNLTDLNIKESIQIAANGQFPKAVILSCLDSRVPVEAVFDQGIGDVFVGRVAGNVHNGDQLGSMEFATKVAGAKVVLVLGHEACGAVKGACDSVEMGNLTGLLEKVQPAIQAVQSNFPADQRNSKNTEFVDTVISENVRQTVAGIRRDSPILAEMEQNGAIKIVGAVYDLDTGKVSVVK